MTDPIVKKPYSSSVGDYIKAIWDLGGIGSASTKDVAARLLVSPASVSNMFVRLQEMGLAEYERYQGASLTERGRVEALRLVRRHRLIETFLLKHLGYDWQEVHEEAERLEPRPFRTGSPYVWRFLGHPDHDPHGDPIPRQEGTLEVDDSFTLSQANSGPAPPDLQGQGRGRRDARLLRDRTSYRATVDGQGCAGLDGVVVVEDEAAEVYARSERPLRARCSSGMTDPWMTLRSAARCRRSG